MFIFVSHGETYLQEPPFPMDLRLTVRFICWQGLPYKQCTVFMGMNRTAAGTAPRVSRPRVVLTRPCPLPAALSTLGLWLYGSIIVLSACRHPQGAAPAFQLDGSRPAFPRSLSISACGTASSESLAPPLAAQVPHVVPGLVSQDRLAKSVKAGPLIMAVGAIPFPHPLSLGGLRRSSPFPLPRRRRCCPLPAKRACFEKYFWKFSDSGEIQQKLPGWL